jgi:hypothetical protein
MSYPRPYTSRERDRGRLAVTAVTGLGAVGALTTTGWLAGVAAADFATEQAATSTSGTSGGGGSTQSVADRRADRGRALRERPYVTRVTIRYLPRAVSVPVSPASSPVTSPVTSVAPAASSSSSSGSSGGSGSSGSSGSSGPPAPSSGS